MSNVKETYVELYISYQTTHTLPMKYMRCLIRDIKFEVCFFDIWQGLASLSQSKKEYIVNRINNDLHNISRWTYLWRTRFDIDHSKPALEIIFSRKIKVSAHLQFLFNNNPAHQTSTQKYIGIFLDFSCETFRSIFRTCSIKLMKP